MPRAEHVWNGPQQPLLTSSTVCFCSFFFRPHFGFPTCFASITLHFCVCSTAVVVGTDIVPNISQVISQVFSDHWTPTKRRRRFPFWNFFHLQFFRSIGRRCACPDSPFLSVYQLLVLSSAHGKECLQQREQDEHRAVKPSDTEEASGPLSDSDFSSELISHRSDDSQWY